MKRPLLSLTMLLTSFSAFGGGATGGMGVIIEGNKELSLSYVGQFENMALLKASQRSFDAIGTVADPNVAIRFNDHIVYGRIMEPEFADAISVETEDGNNLVIVNEIDSSD